MKHSIRTVYWAFLTQMLIAPALRAQSNKAASCAAASGIGAFLGTIAFAAGLATLVTPVGGAAWLTFTAISIIAGVPATGLSIGTAIACIE